MVGELNYFLVFHRVVLIYIAASSIDFAKLLLYHYFREIASGRVLFTAYKIFSVNLPVSILNF